MQVVDVVERGSPLILSMPHGGTGLPDEVAAGLNETGRAIPDTDWWIDRVYDFAAALDATVVRARLSRYVIDVNRDPEGGSLYPGQATTGLCPDMTFDGDPIYRDGEAPDGEAVASRRARYFEPYHEALAAQIARVRGVHGIVALYDCHSIRSRVPRLFEGELPVFNIGTNGGRSCDPAMAAGVRGICLESPFPAVVDGRFRGGWITRHYGRPEAGVHAIQMELAQRVYMAESPPWTYDEALAAAPKRVLERVLRSILDWARETSGGRR